MGCDIHIVIQRQDSGQWREVLYQEAPWGKQKAIPNIPVAPEVFRCRNYDTFALLADVRNGRGFAGVKMGEGWPSIAADRGLPDGFDQQKVLSNPRYPDEGPRWIGDHSFTWVALDELKAFGWDTTLSWLYGVVTAEEYDRLSTLHEAPKSYCGGISGPDIATYEPDEYREAKARGTLAKKPHVRMGWPETAREATNDWPGKVIPWLEQLADGHRLRLVFGFDS